MKNLVLVVVLTALAVIPATAQNVFQVTSGVAISADCYSTVRGLKDKTFGEDNPILGQRPSAGKVLTFCGAALTADVFGVKMIHNSTIRNVIWMAVTSVESYAFIHNFKVTGVIRF